ncbi:uncharacterized protein K460DRAFT_383633 [Cucurbitaria berberidis CBS 394.84]|uniref:Uncharacterized protein n=1 Tax=Cucurbitaria berberidis CBS 394.84 TaxID=1168544 RepID=A0A9P4GKA6_9PLEO|nr:uncharacterized protein K460DRAFT_383633 [Cucurbitaria berberidis CBS 394.84]KAF1847140.1 hypothetical protein K460DRAFT_383633 [Cucurbitaria berberidis CBS 394.84]
MMYSPRSYPYLHPSPPSPRSRTSEKMGTRASRNSPIPRSVKPIEPPTPTINNTQSTSNSEPRPEQPPTTMLAHSQPVVIPPRMPLHSATSTQSVRARGHNGGRPTRSSKSHDPNAIPPAVAALLAVTAIPKMPSRRRKHSTRDRRISMDELIQEWKQDDSDVPPSLVGSPLDVLLGRVDESDDEYGSLASMEQEKESFVTSRSISSDSITTIPPSLDFDDPSFSSHWDNLSTPDSLSRKSLAERKEKAVSSPPKEDCVLDHPLLHFGPEEYDEVIATNITEGLTSATSSNERFKSFKSNLTASLQALKSAAKSFSNFTAPSVPPDDFLTRSLLSPRFTSEMRPKHLEGLPSPELRRYLNPQPSPISPTELSMHLHDSLTLDADDDTQAPMIQMQTYERRGRSQKSRRSRTSDPLSEAGRALSNEPTVRQREPRENSDFLRVIVLEMNMRRIGKLDGKAVGKARIWLPPRKLGTSKAPATDGMRNSLCVERGGVASTSLLCHCQPSLA